MGIFSTFKEYFGLGLVLIVTWALFLPIADLYHFSRERIAEAYPLFGQASDLKVVWTEIPNDVLLDMFVGAGYELESRSEDQLILKDDRYGSIFVSSRSGSIRIEAQIFEPDEGVTLDHLNRWNATHQLYLLYAGSRGEVYLQASLSTQYGITKKQLQAIVSEFRSVVAETRQLYSVSRMVPAARPGTNLKAL